MNKEETTKILAILKAAYPNNYKNMTITDARATVNVWQTEFSDIPAEIVLIAVYKAISVSDFPPTVAAIRKLFRTIYIESEIALNDAKDGTPEKEKYSRIKKILQSDFSARNCPEIALKDILNNLSGALLETQHDAKSGQITANGKENENPIKKDGEK